MATAYPSSVRTDYAADLAFKTTQAQALVDRNKVLVQYPFAYYFAETSWTATSAHTMNDFDLPVHSAIAGMVIAVYVDAKVTTGTGKLMLAIGGTGGTEVDVTATDYAKSGPIVYTLSNSGAYNDFTAVSIALWGKAPSGGTIYARGSANLWCWFTD